MSDPISSISAVTNVTPDAANIEMPPAKLQSALDGNDDANQRLVIEAVGQNRFVYKVMDRVTGEVIRQLPREEVEKLITDPAYRQGGVVSTSV
ncbi:flagellar protein FlaG [Brevundimonas sp.]|uniref:flagellar protein FlaG n=1 Tax=Brevundimonas sp. TaxID=1871086 RepID=UPI00289C5F96|nr:flagellar protein FlaG [Brevundimonas sp.]